MKKAAFIFLILYILVGSAYGQEPRFIFDGDTAGTRNPDIPPISSFNNSTMVLANDTAKFDSLSNVPPAIPAWTIDSRLGTRIPVPMDTLFNNYHRSTLVDGQEVAVAYLGNWGSPAQTKIFFERDEVSQFYFLDAFKYYYKRPEDHVFLDTKKPYSNFSYWSGGGRKSKEERFTGEMSLSFNKRFSIGFDVDYVYSRGYYESLSNKQISYDIFASYKTDRYQMHAFVANNNYTNLENGGLKSLDSDFVSQDSKALPTRMYDTWNKLRGRRLYMTHKYTVGYDEKDTDEFVPVASAIFTTNYTDQRRSFTSNQVQLLDDSVYNYVKSNDYDLSGSTLNDRMSYYSFKNTFGISLNEGFRESVKFGLTAFIEQDIRKYSMPGQNYTDLSSQQFSEKSTVIGGVLSKRKGEFLQYNLSADLGILGYNAGELRLNADITNRFKIAGKDALVKANGYIKNVKPTFFQNQLMSRYYRWENNNFSDTRRVFVGGEVYIPFSNTRLSGGVENISNYIYYTKKNDSLSVSRRLISNSPIEIKQHSDKQIQVVSFRLDQKLNVGILHWDNHLVFQTSSNEEVLPLPKLSLYSNLYIQSKIAKVLDVQLGVDTYFHSEYYAPGYDPALLQFYNQQESKIGNFLIATAYANFHLKKTRFFVMMYNIGRNLKDSQYFSIPNYLVNPMIFKFGLSWNFTD